MFVVTLSSVPGVHEVTAWRSYHVTAAGNCGGENRDGRGGPAARRGRACVPAVLYYRGFSLLRVLEGEPLTR